MRDSKAWSEMRESIIGLGRESSRRTYYPELMSRIAELEAARNELRISEENLRTIFNSLNDAIFIHDWEGGLIEVNDAMLTMYAVTRDNFRSFTVADYSADPDSPQANKSDLKSIFQRLRDEGSVIYEWRARRPLRPGTDFDVEVSLHKATWYDQSVVVAVVRDIFERKRLEAMLRQSQKLDALGQLAGGIAHDTNNMLGVIIGYTDLLIEELPEASPFRTDLHHIRTAALRSADLNRQLLGFARKQTIQPLVVNLNLLVDGTQKMLRRLIGEQHELLWMPGPELWNLWVDPSQVDQILTNLVLNARDALRSSGTITIKTTNISVDETFSQLHPDSETGDYVVLSVTDNGKGMNPEIQSRIFEPFFTTKGPGRGTGLGLATVYGIIRQNNGFLSVYSAPDLGTTFNIYFPRHRGSDPPDVLPAAIEPKGGSETILLVEDEESLLRLGTRVLLEAGYRVIAAQDPLEALEKIRNGLQPDLLVTDLVMPGLNGRELFHAARSYAPGMKGLFVSGYPSETLRNQEPTSEGYPAFLQKPFTRIGFLSKVREAFDRR
jgi:two-component system, cell cycle sensor histidine kinase and response regulator CckA